MAGEPNLSGILPIAEMRREFMLFLRALVQSEYIALVGTWTQLTISIFHADIYYNNKSPEKITV